MPLTHYPKTQFNCILAWQYPRPPEAEPFPGSIPFSEINLMYEPLPPGKTVFGYHAAQPFTRFYGSIACDQSIELAFSFTNQDVAGDGRWVTDESMPLLDYDAEALRVIYDPTKQAQTGRFMITIYGSYLRVSMKNIGQEPAKQMRAYVRGSVF